MGRMAMIGLALCMIASRSWAQNDEPGGGRADPASDRERASSRTVLGTSNPLLARAAEHIRGGDYDEGIRLTLLGLEQEGPETRTRAAALSNLCAAYAAKRLPDAAITHCTESLAITNRNWQAYSNRAYAYWLKEMYAEARFDVDAALLLSPRARQVLEIRGMINEAGLVPRVSMEEHQ